MRERRRRGHAERRSAILVSRRKSGKERSVLFFIYSGISNELFFVSGFITLHSSHRHILAASNGVKI